MNETSAIVHFVIQRQSLPDLTKYSGSNYSKINEFILHILNTLSGSQNKSRDRNRVNCEGNA